MYPWTPGIHELLRCWLAAGAVAVSLLSGCYTFLFRVLFVWASQTCRRILNKFRVLYPDR